MFFLRFFSLLVFTCLSPFCGLDGSNDGTSYCLGVFSFQRNQRTRGRRRKTRGKTDTTKKILSFLYSRSPFLSVLHTYSPNPSYPNIILTPTQTISLLHTYSPNPSYLNIILISTHTLILVGKTKSCQSQTTVVKNI